VAPNEELTESVQFICKDNGWPNKQSVPLNLTIQVSSGEIKVLTKSGGQLTIEEDSSAEFAVKDYIFFKPPPPPDDNLTYTEDSSENLDITITDGIANITPDPDWCGSEVVTFTGTGQKNDVSNQTSLKVTVTCINDPPVINSHNPDGPQTLPEGGSMVFEVNATDVDTGADLMKFKWMVDGKVVPSLLDNFNYTPDFTDSGTHNITVEVNDSQIMVSFTWDTVVVTEVNRVPVGVEIAEPELNATFKKGKKVMLKASTASDPDGDPLNYTWYDGTEQLGQNKTLEVKFKKKGPHEIKLVVDDGRGGETVDTVNIRVKEDSQNGPGFEALVLFIAVMSVLAIMSRRRKRTS
jgi:hypothetical protein